MPESSDKPASDAAKWYDLFSRGARDWLRHDEKFVSPSASTCRR